VATSFDLRQTQIRREEALAYHSSGRRGKIEVTPTKALSTARDLSLAYSPGVAEPCLDIAKDPDLSYTYTARGNLVGVISNGTAVLGLGNIGAYAGKPVMEGKGVLFKKFADLDVFDLEVDANDVDTFCTVVKALEPTFGGVNLEDIKSPECFEIEERLRTSMQIPVFHDDQHGTAIISGAALLNALALAKKELSEVKVVVSGAGASAIACARFFVSLGVRKENTLLVDTKGVVYEGRADGMNKYKAEFAAHTTRRTLAEAMDGADVFLGCSAKGVLTAEMVATMAPTPVVLALANPDPEIDYDAARAVRPDAIVATGRSDFPNQVNNVLGFPFIFRGALDVRARGITEGMKRAAARALAALAREEVPESVSRAYGGERFAFGPDYIIPKPFDPRVLLWVAPAVAQAAMDDGVARIQVEQGAYREQLQKLQSRSHSVMSVVFSKVRGRAKRIAFPEGNQLKVLQAAQVLSEEKLCTPVLLGDAAQIRELIEANRIDALKDVEILDPHRSEHYERLADAFWRMRQRHGLSLREARDQVHGRNIFAALALRDGLIDGIVTGLTRTYPEAVRPALQIVKTRDGRRAGGVYVLVWKGGFKFLADCTVNVDPTPDQLADIAARTADLARYFDVVPRVAMLSYSNFGSAGGASPSKVRETVALLKARRPDLEVDGEMQVDVAVNPELRDESFPFTTLKGDANVLIFPNLDAANIGYKLLWRLGEAEVIGPILTGMNLPVNVLQMGASVDDIVSLAAVTALRALGDEFAF